MTPMSEVSSSAAMQQQGGGSRRHRTQDKSGARTGRRSSMSLTLRTPVQGMPARPRPTNTRLRCWGSTAGTAGRARQPGRRHQLLLCRGRGRCTARLGSSGGPSGSGKRRQGVRPCGGGTPPAPQQCSRARCVCIAPPSRSRAARRCSNSQGTISRLTPMRWRDPSVEDSGGWRSLRCCEVGETHAWGHGMRKKVGRTSTPE